MTGRRPRRRPVRSRSVARTRGAAAAAVGTVVALSAGSVIGFAVPALADAPPGDLQVLGMSAMTGSTAERADAMCRFYLHAVGFGDVRQISWTVGPRPAHRGAEHSEGRLSEGRLPVAGGTGRSGWLRLPAGEYDVSWTAGDDPADSRTRAFTVSCPDRPEAAAGATGDGPAAEGSLAEEPAAGEFEPADGRTDRLAAASQHVSRGAERFQTLAGVVIAVAIIGAVARLRWRYFADD